MESKQYALVLGGITLLLVGGVTIAEYLGDTQTSDDLQVTASFYPFYDITSEIAGDRADVNTLVPPGQDAHGFDPSPQDMARVANADLYVATGAEFGQWEEQILRGHQDVAVVDPSGEIDLIPAENGHHHHDHGHDDHHEEHHDDHDEHHDDEHDHEHDDHDATHDGHSHDHTHQVDHHDHDDEHHDDHDEHQDEHVHEDEHEHAHDEEDHAHDHDHGDYDPHYWVSPENAIVIAEEVRDALQEQDPENADYYEQRADDYIAELEALHSDYEERLSDCEHDRILTAHAAFAYLGDAYGFEQVPLLGLSTTSEPTPGQVQTLIDEAEEHGIDYVFYEEMVDPRVSQTIADEVGAETLVLNPGEVVEDPDATYISIMEQNLENLETALECQ